jgi:hypothetical protein
MDDGLEVGEIGPNDIQRKEINKYERIKEPIAQRCNVDAGASSYLFTLKIAFDKLGQQFLSQKPCICRFFYKTYIMQHACSKNNVGFHQNPYFGSGKSNSLVWFFICSSS